MKNNYNDIIDIILTFTEDEEFAQSIAISGSIVPYIIANKESFECHTDFYILVKEKKIAVIREKIKKLSKEYEFDIISDSKKYSKNDFGFKIKYQGTIVGFFPYSIINNNFTIKNYSIEKENEEIKLKTKIIPNVTKNIMIRLVNFGKGRKLRIMSPEFILLDKEMREKQPGNPTKETMSLLNKISDESIIKVLRESMENSKVKITSTSMKDDNKVLFIILSALILLLIVVAYICFN